MGGVSVVLFMLLGAGDTLTSYHSAYSNTCYTITSNSDGTSLSTLFLTVLLGPCCAIMTVFWWFCFHVVQFKLFWTELSGDWRAAASMQSSMKLMLASYTTRYHKKSGVSCTGTLPLCSHTSPTLSCTSPTVSGTSQTVFIHWNSLRPQTPLQFPQLSHFSICSTLMPLGPLRYHTVRCLTFCLTLRVCCSSNLEMSGELTEISLDLEAGVSELDSSKTEDITAKF